MNTVEIARKLIRESSVGRWYEITDRTTFTGGDTGEYTRTQLEPHAPDWKPIVLEFAHQSRNGRAEWPFTGWYADVRHNGDPVHMARRKADAMQEAEIWVAVLTVGGTMSTLHSGVRPTRNVVITCKGCGHRNPIRVEGEVWS